MQTEAKLRILADSAKYDASCASSGSKRAGTREGLGHSDGTGICHSYTPDGRCVSLLKVLLTNYCVYDCLFCVNRVSNDVPRARFAPEELVRLTLEFYKRNYIEGLFLSSGIIQSPDYTMEQLIAVARSLRQDHRFNGYIHLKAIPGASAELLQEAGKYADRLSANIELPTSDDLARLAPDKKLDTIHQAMAEIANASDASREELKTTAKAPAFAPAGQTTQLVVGATATSDGTILQTAATLYRKHKLRRIYYLALGFDRIILLQLGSVLLVGYYAPVAAIITGMGLFTEAVISYLYPRLSYRLGQEGDARRLWRPALLATLAGMAMATPAAAIGWFLVPAATEAFFPAYAASVPAMRLALFTGVLLSARAITTPLVSLKAWKFAYAYIALFAGAKWILPWVLARTTDPLMGVTAGAAIASAIMAVVGFALTYRATLGSAASVPLAKHAGAAL